MELREILKKTGKLKIEGIGTIQVVPTAPKNNNLGEVKRKLKLRLVTSNACRDWLNEKE